MGIVVMQILLQIRGQHRKRCEGRQVCGSDFIAGAQTPPKKRKKSGEQPCKGCSPPFVSRESELADYIRNIGMPKT